jgi:hypothetical protein
MGIYNSSLTRVQPVFEHLYERDQSGTSWLLPLLRLASHSNHLPVDFDPGQLVEPPRYEFAAPPPREFLRFLLTNPDQLAIPAEHVWRKSSATTQAKRRALLSGDRTVQREGLTLLEKATDLSQRTWWRFEGVSYVDCALFTQSTVVFVEGKRTEEGPSQEVTWWTGRNQIIRNMECVPEVARATGRSQAFVVVVVEEELCEPGTQRARSINAITDPNVIASSLPHLQIQAREQLMGRYVGATTWQGIVRSLDLDPAILIDAVQLENR